MAPLTNAFRRVPKWAWYTSGGVALAGGVMYVFRNRAGAPEEEEGAPEDASVTGYPDFGAPSPVPGVVVPDVVVGSGEGGFNSMELHNAYIQGLQTLFDTLTNRPVIEPSPSEPVPVQVTITPTGGGVASEERQGVVTAPRPPSQAPAAKPRCLYNGHCLSWWRNPNHNRRNGKWRWPDGGGFKHSREFEGHKACDGGGNAGGSKVSC